MREEQIVAALRDGSRTIPDLVRKIYGPEPHALSAAMARQILAHLLALQAEGRVVARPGEQGLSAEEYAMLQSGPRSDRRPRRSGRTGCGIGAEMRLESLDEYTLVC